MAAGLLFLAVFLMIRVRGQAGETTVSRPECEKQYLMQVRSVLEEKGYSDCGLMLNYVREPDGVRSYTLTVYHGRIARLEEGQRGEILEALAEVPFAVENSTVSGRFLDVP